MQKILLIYLIQADEGMAERKKIADVTKTVPGVKLDKSGVLFKISVHGVRGTKTKKENYKC